MPAHMHWHYLQSDLLVKILLNRLFSLGARTLCGSFRLDQSFSITAILLCHSSAICPRCFPLLVPKANLFLQDPGHFLVSLLLLFQLVPFPFLVSYSALGHISTSVSFNAQYLADSTACISGPK